MSMDSVQARLRRTFKHDDDDEDEDDGNRATALDDIQQESLITSLHQSAQSTDLLYTRILTLLPLLAILPFCFSFLFLSTPHPHTFLSLVLAAVAVLSLILTAWTTYFVPPSVTTTSTTTAAAAATTTTTATTAPGQAQGHSHPPWWMPFRWPEKRTKKTLSTYSPAGDYDCDYDYLAQILTWLNLAVVSLLFAVGSYESFYAAAAATAATAPPPPAVEGGGGGYGMPSSLLLLLPGVMFAAVSVVRQSMADVQSGVRDLHGLRYELKGA